MDYTPDWTLYSICGVISVPKAISSVHPCHNKALGMFVRVFYIVDITLELHIRAVACHWLQQLFVMTCADVPTWKCLLTRMCLHGNVYLQ